MLKRLFRVLVSLAVLAFDLLRDATRRLVGAPRPARWVVLYYHSVPEEYASTFARQMAMALRWAVPVPPTATTLPHGRRCFAVTFDDALAEIRDTALPVLRARGIPAAVFVPTAFVDRAAAWEMAKGCSEQGRNVMSFAELRALDEELVLLGSHTVSHPCLSTLPQKELVRELRESRRVLEEQTGRRVTLLSFPHGDYDARVLAAAKEAGYTRCFSISPDCQTPEEARFVFGRVKADPRDWPMEFRLKVLGCYRWLGAASRAKAYVCAKKVNGKAVAPRKSLVAAAKRRQCSRRSSCCVATVE
ncbi:MAG: polysaccharide deacetylase family protein [Calditrichaeota bacterium]|nr:polysaccharide deacetylase family protein [Calditrichota bacterium]